MTEAKIWKDLFIWATNEWDFKQGGFGIENYGEEAIAEFFEFSRTNKHIEELKKVFVKYAKSNDWEYQKEKLKEKEKK